MLPSIYGPVVFKSLIVIPIHYYQLLATQDHVHTSMGKVHPPASFPSCLAVNLAGLGWVVTSHVLACERAALLKSHRQQSLIVHFGMKARKYSLLFSAAYHRHAISGEKLSTFAAPCVYVHRANIRRRTRTYLYKRVRSAHVRPCSLRAGKS